LDESDESVGLTRDDFHFSFPKGVTNYEAQSRVISASLKLFETYDSKHIAIGTHGLLLALILNYFDPNVDLNFRLRLTMPDIYVLEIGGPQKAGYSRMDSDYN
jgi:2,3-bisphosphoglycerate-dependent phosphoglycerate mutase